MKIAITGIGVVSTFGVGRDAFWRNVRAGISGTRAISDFDASSYPCRVAAAVPPVTIEAAKVLLGEQDAGNLRRNGHSKTNGNGSTPIRDGIHAPPCLG